MNEKKEEIKKSQIVKKKILDFLNKNYITITAVLIALQTVFVFIPASFIIVLLLLCTNTFVFSLVKDTLDEKTKKTGMFIFKLAVLCAVMGVINSLFAPLNASLLTKGKSLIVLQSLISIGIGIWLFAFSVGEQGKNMLNRFYETSILDALGIDLGDKELNHGDVILCNNKDTQKPIVLNATDRFLHMLILGPTGCGKTSQIITPMINQDMQNIECGITVIEPKGDLAEKVYAMAKHYGRDVVYFNPILPDCPYFNPLYGNEVDVIENMATTFKMLNPDSPQFFQDMNENLIRKSLIVLKRLKGDTATLIDLSTLIQNAQGLGKKMVTQFSRLKAENEEIAKENGDIASWFLTDYFNEKSKTYEHCSGLRSQVAKITSNKYLRRVLNPPNGLNDVNFEKHLANNGVLAIATAQGTLRDLGRFLGYFIILNLQSSVFKRPGSEFTRLHHFLYIDEFQVYSNPGFADMLTQGRSYRVASHLATQNRALMAMGSGRDGKNFVELVSTNARNIIIFPGGNSIDAKYYSDEFGEVKNIQIQKGISQAKFNPLLYGFNAGGAPTESIREAEVVEARYSASDIIFRPFGEVTYRIIKNNSVSTPGIGKVEYIPKELNSILNKMVDQYNEEQENKKDSINLRKQEDVEEMETANLSEIPNIIIGEEIYKSKQVNTNKVVIDKDIDYTDDIVVTKEEIDGGKIPDDLGIDLDDPEYDDLI